MFVARALILDDDPVIGAVLSELIRTLGHETMVCETLTKGIDAARCQEFDLIYTVNG